MRSSTKTELALEQVLRHRLVVVAVGGVLEPPLRSTHQPLLPHEPNDSVATHPDALLSERAMDAWAPVLPATLRASRVSRVHMHLQHCVRLVVGALASDRRPGGATPDL